MRMRLPRGVFFSASLVLLGACGGGGGGGGLPPGPPTGLSYTSPLLLRVGDAATPASPTISGGAPTLYAVLPAFPSGVALDPSTGVISGTPTASSPTAAHVVTASNTAGSTQFPVVVQVTPALPPEFLTLAPGFTAELVVGTLAEPVKMDFAADGRLFFNELSSGNVRVIDATGALVGTPFATETILSDGEKGLLGLALAPDFATSGNVFLFVSVAAGGGHLDRNQVVRWTATGNVGGSRTVIVDDLPIANAHNAGDLRFGADGMLYVTTGDVGDPILSQTDGSHAGRILRYMPDGTIPADNPVAGDPEWCRGLRNTFDLTVHPITGGIFASENGPMSDDEIEYVQKGKNYEWGAAAGSIPPPTIGFRVRTWTPVIAPTGIAFYTGGGFGSGFDDNLFVLGYVGADIRRLVLSGASLVDVDAEVSFASFVDVGGVDNKPLDIVKGADGALYVSTFTAIWRIKKSP